MVQEILCKSESENKAHHTFCEINFTQIFAHIATLETKMNIGKLTFTYCHLNVSPYKWPPSAYVNYSSAWALGFIVRCEFTLLNQGQGHYYRSFGNENLTLSFMPYRVSPPVWSKWWVCFSSGRNVGAGASPPSLSQSLWPGCHWTASRSADWMIRGALHSNVACVRIQQHIDDSVF